MVAAISVNQTLITTLTTTRQVIHADVPHLIVQDWTKKMVRASSARILMEMRKTIMRL